MPYGVKEPLEVRFWRGVAKSEGCWEWQAALTTTGYGYMWDGARMTRTHRISWVLAFGEIPGGLWVLHRCDNRKCVRPSHLFLGTNRDNVIDKEQKGRGNHPFGESAGKAKLTFDQVREIRRRLDMGEMQREIAAKYGVSKSTIGFIATRRSWRSV